MLDQPGHVILNEMARRKIASRLAIGNRTLLRPYFFPTFTQSCIHCSSEVYGLRLAGKATHPQRAVVKGREAVEVGFWGP